MGVGAGRVDRRVSIVDLAANVSELARISWSGGGAVWPELLGRKQRLGQAAVSESILFGRERKAVLLGDWKAIWGPDKKELYYLKEDPKERKDVSGMYPDVLEGLQIFLPKNTPQTWVPANTLGVDIEALEQLGYVEGE